MKKSIMLTVAAAFVAFSVYAQNNKTCPLNGKAKTTQCCKANNGKGKCDGKACQMACGQKCSDTKCCYAGTEQCPKTCQKNCKAGKNMKCRNAAKTKTNKKN